MTGDKTCLGWPGDSWSDLTHIIDTRDFNTTFVRNSNIFQGQLIVNLAICFLWKMSGQYTGSQFSIKSLKHWLEHAIFTGHINNLYNTCFWCLVQQSGLTAEQAEDRLNVSTLINSTPGLKMKHPGGMSLIKFITALVNFPSISSKNGGSLGHLYTLLAKTLHYSPLLVCELAIQCTHNFLVCDTGVG